MGALVKFLVSLAAHAAWMRLGQRGPVPPLRLKGKTTRLPLIAPWQLIAASWALKYLWKLFGPEVTGRLAQTRSPALRRLGAMLPRPSGVLGKNAPAASPPAASSPATAAPQATPAYDTRPLSSQSPLPSGSVLSSLRDSTA